MSPQSHIGCTNIQLLLSGEAMSVMHKGGCVLVDDWLRIRASAPTAVLVEILRSALDALTADKVGSMLEFLLTPGSPEESSHR